MFTEIGWTILHYPMLTMLTWMCPAYFHIIILFYKTVIPDTRVLVSLVPPIHTGLRLVGSLRARTRGRKMAHKIQLLL